MTLVRRDSRTLRPTSNNDSAALTALTGQRASTTERCPVLVAWSIDSVSLCQRSGLIETDSCGVKEHALANVSVTSCDLVGPLFGSWHAPPGVGSFRSPFVIVSYSPGLFSQFIIHTVYIWYPSDYLIGHLFRFLRLNGCLFAFSQFPLFWRYSGVIPSVDWTESTCWFLPRDAMRKRGLCCRPVSVRLSIYLSVRLSRSYIVSGRLKIASNFFLSLPGSPIILVFRLDAWALSVIATATWLAGWLAGSVTLRYCIKTAKRIRKLFRPSKSPIILVFWDPCADTKFQGEPHQRGR